MEAFRVYEDIFMHANILLTQLLQECTTWKLPNYCHWEAIKKTFKRHIYVANRLLGSFTGHVNMPLERPPNSKAFKRTFQWHIYTSSKASKLRGHWSGIFYWVFGCFLLYLLL